jgi:hypothetical protein
MSEKQREQVIQSDPTRRSFFRSLALLSGAAVGCPGIFIPKFEPVRWRVINPGLQVDELLLERNNILLGDLLREFRNQIKPLAQFSSKAEHGIYWM